MLGRASVQEAWGEARVRILRESSAGSSSHVEDVRRDILALFQQAPVAILVLQGPDHRVVLANQLLSQLVSPRTFKEGAPLREVAPELERQPFLRMLDSVYEAGGRDVAANCRIELGEEKERRQARFFNMVVQATRNSAGEVTGVMAVGREITQERLIADTLRDHQARLRAAIEAGSVATFTWDTSTDRLRGDRQLAQMFGLDAARVATGQLPMSELIAAIHPEDRGSAHWELQHALQTGDEYTSQFRVVTADGTRWVMARGRLEPDNDGGKAAFPAAVFDITDQKHAERALLDADRAKDEFLAMLGHELRNPLAPIQTAVHLIRLRGVKGIDREVGVIQRQVDHLSRLVDDLLDVARITKGRIEIHKERIELVEVVSKAIEVSSPLLESRQHRLSIHVPTEGLMVDGDPARLVQVVSNLLTNAAKYTEQGGQIHVRAFRRDNEIVTQVQDNGIGIRGEMLSTVFDTFSQERQSLERSQGGLGLGLAIVKNFVQLHGGRVEAHSEGPGTGSTFTFVLPAAEGEAPRVQPAVSPVMGHVAGAALHRRVLVVDDNEDAALMMAEYVSALGYATRVVHDGPSALRAAEELVPHVALVDIGLPVMNGYELAKRLRAMAPLAGMRLVAVTGYGQDVDRRRSAAAGFDAHLIKPVDLDRLVSLLRA